MWIERVTRLCHKRMIIVTGSHALVGWHRGLLASQGKKSQVDVILQFEQPIASEMSIQVTGGCPTGQRKYQLVTAFNRTDCNGAEPPKSEELHEHITE